MEIIKKEKGRYELRDESGKSVGNSYTGTDFYKIDKVREESSCYCLWPNDLCFYLYNSSCGSFIGRGNVDYWSYSKIQHYSEKTRTFAAYRNDSDYVHLIYEDGKLARDTFLAIGPEIEDEYRSRPVKYTLNGTRWCFYETKRNKLAWNKASGLKVGEEWALAQRYNNMYYSCVHENGLYELLFYNRNRHETHFFDPYENERYWFKSIKQEGSFLVAESKYGFYYIFDTNSYKKLPLCSSVDKPYWSNGRIIISNGENWQLVVRANPEKYGTVVVENYKWEVDKRLLVKGDYVFCQNGENGSWRIYDRENGCEIYTDWKNIKVKENPETKEIKLLVDTASLLQWERTIDDIKAERERWLSSLGININNTLQESPTHLNQQEEDSKPKEMVWEEAEPERLDKQEVEVQEKQEEVQEKHENDKDETLANRIEKIEISTKRYVERPQSLPDHIEYITSVRKVKFIDQSKNFINCDRACHKLQMKSNILWYSRDDKKLYVTIFKRKKTYQVLYETQLEHSLSCENRIPKSFTEIGLSGVTEGNLIAKLNEYYTKGNGETAEPKIEKVRELLHSLNITDECITKVVGLLKEELNEKEKVKLVSSHCDFTFRKEKYSLQVDDVWNLDNPFYRKRFLESEIIAILIDDTFVKSSQLSDVDYEMIGQGKDKKYDQCFDSSVNLHIRDKSKRVLLFEQQGEHISFFDEVEAAGYHMIAESSLPDSRKVIKFFLKSLMRKRINNSHSF